MDGGSHSFLVFYQYTFVFRPRKNVYLLRISWLVLRGLCSKPLVLQPRDWRKKVVPSTKEKIFMWTKSFSFGGYFESDCRYASFENWGSRSHRGTSLFVELECTTNPLLVWFAHSAIRMWRRNYFDFAWAVWAIFLSVHPCTWAWFRTGSPLKMPRLIQYSRTILLRWFKTSKYCSPIRTIQFDWDSIAQRAYGSANNEETGLSILSSQQLSFERDRVLIVKKLGNIDDGDCFSAMIPLINSTWWVFLLRI